MSWRCTACVDSCVRTRTSLYEPAKPAAKKTLSVPMAPWLNPPDFRFGPGTMSMRPFAGSRSARLLVEIELPVQRHRLRRRQHFLLALGQRMRPPAADRFDRVAIRRQLRLRGDELGQPLIGEREDLVLEEGALRVGVGFQRVA